MSFGRYFEVFFTAEKVLHQFPCLNLRKAHKVFPNNF